MGKSSSPIFFCNGCFENFGGSCSSEIIDSSSNINVLSFSSLIEGLESERMCHSRSKSDGISSISVAVTETVKTLFSSAPVEGPGNQGVPQSSIVTEALPITTIGSALVETLDGSLPSSDQPSVAASDTVAPGNPFLLPHVGPSLHANMQIFNEEVDVSGGNVQILNEHSAVSNNVEIIKPQGLEPSTDSAVELDLDLVPSERVPPWVGGRNGDCSCFIGSQNCDSSPLDGTVDDHADEDEAENRELEPPSYDDYDSPKPECHTLVELSNWPLESLESPQYQLNWSWGEDREYRCWSFGRGREDRTRRWNPFWPQNRVDHEDSNVWITGPTGVGAGLENLGNTCFVNAILQCFTHTVPLIKALWPVNHIMPCENEGFCVLCFLCEHVALAIASSGKTIEPLKLVNNLNEISSDFVRHQQEDAHEFLQCFLNKLEECTLDSRSTGHLSSQDDSIVKQVFGGCFVSKLRCCNCGHSSDRDEPFIDLSLEIDDVDTLECALESFTKVEKMEDTKYTCEICREEVYKEKQLMLAKAPLVAALHLKLFKIDDNVSFQKINKHIEFPLQLDLKPFTNGTQDDNEELRYQLYAIVEHRGRFLHSGHYLSYIRSSPDTWHMLNDERVIKVQEETVLSTDAYILFYVKQGTPWFSSLMESQILSKDLSVPYSSPKSVLDTADSFNSIANSVINKDKLSDNAVEGTSTQFSCETMLDEVQIETREDTEGTSADGLYRSRQNRLHLLHNESSDDDFTVDAFNQPEESNSIDGILHEKHGPYSENYTDRANENRRNGRWLKKSCSSPSPDELQPESRSRNPRAHLKVQRKLHYRMALRKAIKGKDFQNGTESCRYLTGIPTARCLSLMAAMCAQNDKRRRLKQSPFKRVNPSGSRRKLSH